MPATMKLMAQMMTKVLTVGAEDLELNEDEQDVDISKEDIGYSCDDLEEG